MEKSGLGRQEQLLKVFPLFCRHGVGQKNDNDGENDKSKHSISGSSFFLKLFGSERTIIFPRNTCTVVV